MESTSKLQSGTFQRSCVITNYTGQNNLRGAINRSVLSVV